MRKWLKVAVAPGISSGLKSASALARRRSHGNLAATEISMTVRDARNKRVLWRGTESGKYALREKARENNLVQAAEKLASKFHDRLEPPATR
jgi:hypothetical protein